MKRLISIFLAISALFPGFFSGTAEDTKERQCVVFSEMEYRRPDLEELNGDFDAVLDALDGFCTFRRLTKLLDSCYEDFASYETMYALADIRSCQDQSDEFYGEEYMWCADNYAPLQQRFDEVYYACAASRLARRLERWYFWDGFRKEYSSAEDSKYSDESVALMQQESALISEYRSAASQPVIEVWGRSVPLEEYLAQANEMEYLYALKLYYEKYNPILSDIYIRLVRVRRALAESMGYDSYEQMQYDFFFERDYSPEQAEEYFEAVRRCILPIYEEIYGDESYTVPDYEPLSQGLLEEALTSVAESMGGDAAEACDFMVKYELWDTELRPNKVGMSFQTYINDYDAPFLFLDPAGDIGDILSLTHEFGHYVDSYVNFNAYETTDLSECYSQSMELLSLAYLGDALDGEQLRQLSDIKALDILNMYVQQSSFAEFEKRVYALDDSELTADRLNALSLELAEKYGYYDGFSRDYYAMSWIDIPHFFEQPFYVVSYPVSNDIAMQVYELEQEASGQGLAKLMEMLPRQSENMIESAAAAGLESPFAPGRVEKAAETLRAMLYNEMEQEAAA